jgi:hypothetical protein
MKTKYSILLAAFALSSLFIFSTLPSEKPDAISGPTYKQPSYNQIEVALLVLDYNTLEIQGHKWFTFQKNYLDTFKLLPFDFVNHFAGDFGNFSCTVANSTDTVTAGSIIWMGKGQMNFPKKLDSTSYNDSQYFSLLTPKSIQYFNNFLGESKEKKEYLLQTAKVFNKIKKLELLSGFNNNNYKLGYYLYTPRIGKTDYSVAKWIVFLERDL